MCQTTQEIQAEAGLVLKGIAIMPIIFQLSPFTAATHWLETDLTKKHQGEPHF